MKQIYGISAVVGVGFTLPDLTAALKQIQQQYDDMAAKSLQVNKITLQPNIP